MTGHDPKREPPASVSAEFPMPPAASETLTQRVPAARPTEAYPAELGSCPSCTSPYGTVHATECALDLQDAPWLVALLAERDNLAAELQGVHGHLRAAGIGGDPANHWAPLLVSMLVKERDEAREQLATQDRQWARCPDSCGCRLAAEAADGQ